jgi:hypothetical protein
MTLWLNIHETSLHNPTNYPGPVLAAFMFKGQSWAPVAISPARQHARPAKKYLFAQHKVLSDRKQCTGLYSLAGLPRHI